MSVETLKEPEVYKRSLLSRDAILRQIELGNIIIDPFDIRHLHTISYDVSLGPHYFREQDLGPLKKFYNPWNYYDVRDVWGRPLKAQKATMLFGSEGLVVPEGIKENDEVIIINPKETILGHTIEFIGGKNIVTSEMKARSSAGRNFLEVCKCAGLGDLGFINRWTMEITNNSNLAITLIVGRRISQIIFHEVDPVTSSKEYSADGKYQKSPNIEELKVSWLPYDMLPKMYLDYEVNDTSHGK